MLQGLALPVSILWAFSCKQIKLFIGPENCKVFIMCSVPTHKCDLNNTLCPCKIGNQEQSAVPPAGEESVMDGEGSAAGEDPAEARAARILHLEDGLKTMFEELAQKLRQDESFEAPTQCLLNSYRKINTDSGLVSALCSFGKERRSNTATTTTMWRKRAQKGLQTSTAIGVQPTAVARRKAPLGGRRALQTGRPPKRARKEHSYGKVKEGGSVLPKRPAPHSLSQCVADGVALGGSHSRK